MRKYN